MTKEKPFRSQWQKNFWWICELITTEKVPGLLRAFGKNPIYRGESVLSIRTEPK